MIWVKLIIVKLMVVHSFSASSFNLPLGTSLTKTLHAQPQMDQLPLLVPSIILPDHFDDQAHDENSC